MRHCVPQTTNVPRHSLACLVLVGCGLLSASTLVGRARAESASNIPQTTVGMRGRLEQLVLPGSRLVVKPATDRQAPVVVRIVASYPHGTAYRYDVEYYALEPGRFDLRTYLEREDGSSLEDVPQLPIAVLSTLPPGQVVPNALVAEQLPRTGGYRTWLVLGAACWGLGLLAILLAGRRHRARRAAAAQQQGLTLEQRLEAIVQQAQEGNLNEADRAELERMVVAYWRRRLALEQVDAAQAMQALREHDEARAALEQLERWLHAPESVAPADFCRLTAPPSPAAEEQA